MAVAGRTIVLQLTYGNPLRSFQGTNCPEAAALLLRGAPGLPLPSPLQDWDSLHRMKSGRTQNPVL